MLDFLRSRTFFYVIAGLLGVQALIIALTARYPMAFDEYFHFGIAQLRTETWSPFLSNVPDNASLYGAVTRDPSFLYHYLLSFPLRLIQLSTDNHVWQILILRFLNIGLAIASLFIYRRLLLRLGASRLATNITMLVFVLLPIVPLMSGQITYDNVFFPAVAAVLLLAVGVIQQYVRAKTINVSKLNWLLLIGLFTCFVKYAFVPALLAIVICLAAWLIKNPRKLSSAYIAWWQTQPLWHKTVTIIALLLGIWFFVGSYGLNTVRYHNPIPKCDKVLSEEACKDYGPWNRDYYLKLDGGHGEISDLPWYGQRWSRMMMRETFFMVGAKYNDRGVVGYFASEPVAGLFVTAWTLLFICLAILVWHIRYLWSRPDFRLILIVFVVYTAALSGLNFQFFLETGQPVAIHGRYLLPFIPPMIALVAVAAGRFKWQPNARQKLIALSVLGLLLLQGGGIISYIVLSNNDWMWPQSQAAQSATSAVRDVISPLVYRR